MFRDSNPPKILKVTFDGGTLSLLTDEVATCRYSNSTSIIFSDMILFDNTGSPRHSTTTKENYLSVKCADRFNNILNFDVYKAAPKST